MNNIIRAYYFLFHIGLGIIFGFLPAYLEAKGLFGTQVSTIMSLGSLCGVFGLSMLWGMLADKIQKPYLVLQILALGTTLGFVPMLFAESYLSMLLTFFIYSACSVGIMGILDSIASVRAKEQGIEFGRMRLFVPGGWLVGSVGLGYYIDLTGKTWNDQSIIIAIVLSFALMFIASLGLKGTSIETKNERIKFSDVRMLFKNKYLVLFLIMALVNYIAISSYTVFYGPLVESKGLSPKIVGLSLGVGTLGEAIFMFYFDKIKKWLGLELIIILTIIISMVRWIIISKTNSPAVLIGIQVLHSEIGLFLMACISIITDSVPRKMVTTAQTIFYTITCGIGQYIGIMLMGFLKDYYGDPAKLFMISAIIHIIPLILAIINMRNKNKPFLK